MKKHATLLRLTISTSLVLSTTATYAAPMYTITDLGHLDIPGGFGSGNDINENGQITGTFLNGPTTRAYIYDEEGMQAIPIIPGTFDLTSGAGGSGAGLAINNSGHVTGFSGREVFIFDGDTVSNIGPLTGQFAGAGRDINNHGTVVGYSSPQIFSYKAFVYDGINFNWLGTLGGQSSEAHSINDSGQITGWAHTSAGMEHAFLYTNGAIQDLGTANVSESDSESRGYDINASGQVTGKSYSPSSRVQQAFLYDGNQMQALGTLGGASSVGYGINDSGQVVGQSVTAQGQSRAFLYEDGVMHDLNSLIDPSDPLAHRAVITAAYSINNQGQITGEMKNLGPASSAFLLTPIIPASDFTGINGLEGKTTIQSGIENSEQVYLGVQGGGASGVQAYSRIGLSGAEALVNWSLQSLSNDGDYQIISVDTTLCMSEIGWSKKPILVSCNPGDVRQSWHISAFGEQFVLRNNKNQQCLAKTTDSQDALQLAYADCYNTPSRAFQLEFTETPPIGTPSPLEGTHSLTPSNSNSQRIGWTETRAGAAATLVANSSDLDWTVTADGEAGHIIQANDTSQPRCLALPSWSNDLPILNRCDDGARQHWEFEGSAATGYSLINEETGRCLSRVAGSDDLLRLRDCDESALQVFNVE